MQNAELIKALVIPAEGSPTTTMVASGSTYDFIRESVGGWFDCVRSEDFHAYVHDTGIIDGQPFNRLASILFGRVICGDIVVFGSLSASGVYDGEEHHVPPMIVNLVAQQWMLLLANSENVHA